MGTHKIAGFTIIEVVLFLGISSLLIVTLIGSAGVSLNQQRYRDAAESFKLVLQQQYADLNSVQNNRSNDWWCGSDALPTDQDVNHENRGQSECILVGKYVRVENNDIAVYDVIGYGDEPSLVTNDIDILRNNYKLNVSGAEVDESTLEWGAQIAWPTSLNGSPTGTPTTPRKLAVLVVRSPSSGQIYTFTANDTDVPDQADIGPSTFTNMLTIVAPAPGRQGSQIVCIDSGGLFTISDRAVYIDSYASSSSAIELRTNDFMTPAVAQC